MSKIYQNQKTPQPIPTIIHSNSKNLDYRDMIKLVSSKKSQYSKELTKKDINLNDHTLMYARSQSSSNPLEEMSERFKDVYRDQMLARGVTITQFSQQPQSNNKPRLLKINLTPNFTTPDKTKSVDKFGKKSESRKLRLKSEAAKNVKQGKFSEYFRVSDRQKSNYQQNAVVKRFVDGVAQLKKGGKNNLTLERVAKDLESFNPFFRKLQRVITVCLLRIGNIIHKSRQSIIYDIGSPSTSFYIILTGAVKLKGQDCMHKICQLGESIHEEILFDKNADSYSLEKAKTIHQSYLLQIQKVSYIRLQSELNRFGFKQGVFELQSLLKRNKIVKNWLRNKCKLINNN